MCLLKVYYPFVRLSSYTSSDVYSKSLTVRKDIEDSVNNCSGIPVMHTFTMESSNYRSTSTNPNYLQVEDSSVLNNAVTDESAAKVNHNYHRYTSQDEITEYDVNLTPKRKKIHYRSSSALCCKISIIFAVFFIIGCHLIPVTLYYVGKSMDRDETEPVFLHQKNISAAKVRMLQSKCT